MSYLDGMKCSNRVTFEIFEIFYHKVIIQNHAEGFKSAIILWWGVACINFKKLYPLLN